MGKKIEFYYEEDLVAGIKDYIEVEEIKNKDWMDILYDGLRSLASNANKNIRGIYKKKKGADLQVVNKGQMKTITITKALIEKESVKHITTYEAEGTKRVLVVGDILYNDLEKYCQFQAAINRLAGDEEKRGFEEIINEALIEEGNRVIGIAHDKILEKEQKELKEDEGKEEVKE